MRRHDHPDLRTFRRSLRTNGTSAEAALWMLLKRGQLEGRLFRRQHSVGRYILDFYCSTERLAVELDGAVHADPFRADYDAEREAALAAEGIRIIRFENSMVFEHSAAVCEMIAACFKKP